MSSSFLLFVSSFLQSGRSRGIGLGKEEEEQLRTFIVNMVSEPLVLVIKLADRLHNMRTVFALKRDKQKAVATETLQVWCSLAERLGMMVLKVRCFSLHDLMMLRCVIVKTVELGDLIEMRKTDCFGETRLVPHVPSSAQAGKRCYYYYD